jgi:3-oxoacyl-[acyl-carrier-protein] synthase III
VRAYLSAIEYEIGEPVPIGTLDTGADGERERIEFLRREGMAHYRRTDKTPKELALGAALRTLRASSLAAGDIDLILYASSSFHTHDACRRDVQLFCQEIGAGNTPVAGVTGMECANVGLAIRNAAAYLSAGLARNVLVVTTDRCAAAQSRLLAPPVAVMSDGAASCIVSSELAEGFEILGQSSHVDHALRFTDRQEDFTTIVKRTALGVHDTIRALFAKCGVTGSDVSQVVANNVLSSFLQLFASQGRVPPERIYRSSLAANGHVYSADTLINLRDHCESAAASGQALGSAPILLMSNAIAAWLAVLLAPVRPNGTASA